jgi:hypothetical protein
MPLFPPSTCPVFLALVVLTSSKPSTAFLRGQRNIPIPVSLFIHSSPVTVLKSLISRIEIVAFGTALGLAGPVLAVLWDPMLPVVPLGRDNLVDLRAL